MKRLLKSSPYLILLAGFALRLYRLGANSLWYDETVSMNLARSDLAELIRHTAGDIHPPLYYILLHFWGRLAGWSEFSAAFLSLWVGVLLVAVVYRVSREWFHSRAQAIALTAAFLVAISPYNIWYSQEVRMYTVGATLGVASVYFLRRLLESEKRSARDLIAYALVTVAGMYTLYYFAFLIAFEWLWVAYRGWYADYSATADGRWRMADGVSQIANRKSQIANQKSEISGLQSLLFRFLLSQALLLILYLPWLPIAFRQATDPPVPPWREFIALPRVILETFSALAFGQAVDANIFGIVAVVACLLLGALLWRESRMKRVVGAGAAATHSMLPAHHPTVSPLFLLGYFLVPLILIFVLSFYKPLYHVRYMFTYSPAFYILAAYATVHVGFWIAGREQKARRWMNGRFALAALVCVGFVGICVYSLDNFWHNEQYAEDDLRGAVNYIAERWRPGDVILVNAGYAYPALTYYFPGTIVRERLTQYDAPDVPTAPADTPLVLQTGSIDGAPSLGWGDPRSDFYATTAAETDAALDKVFQEHPRVWMLRIYDTVVDPNGVIRAYFEQHATPLDDQGFTGESQTRVQGFLTQPTRELPPNAVTLNQNLGDRAELVGYETGARDLARGSFFDVVLYWKLLQTANYNYQVTLQILDGGGNKVAQAPDEAPLSDLLPMTRWEVGTLYREPLRVKLDTLVPGTYKAIAKMYEPRSGQVLGEVIELGTVTILP